MADMRGANNQINLKGDKMIINPYANQTHFVRLLIRTFFAKYNRQIIERCFLTINDLQRSIIALGYLSHKGVNLMNTTDTGHIQTKLTLSDFKKQQFLHFRPFH